MDERCDGKADCPDRSDEEYCKGFITYSGYNKFLVPPPLVNESSLLLNISININKIKTVNENDGFLKIKFTMLREWLNTQLTFQNLKRDGTRNLITKEDRERMWKPWFSFKNTEHLGDTKATDMPDMMWIIPNKKFNYKRDDRTNYRNTRLFNGDENVISFQRQLTVNWECNYNMKWFPFDVQKCRLEMFTPDFFLTLNPTTVRYSGPLELPQHFVQGVTICPAIIEDRSGLVVEVILGRCLSGTILSLFMPTCILLVLSQMVMVFSRNHLELVIDVNMTLILVLATL